MNKKEKLEMLSYFVGELGLSYKEVAEYLLAEDLSAKATMPQTILPGMYVYADGLIYPEIIEGRQVMAIVGSVDGSDVLAVCLQEACLPWFSDWQGAEAAQWCYDYAEDGVKQGEAFLPSLTELEKLFANKAAINASLKALGVALLEGWYWSSTEYDNNYAWIFGMTNGARNDGSKLYYVYVRSVLALKL